MKIEIRGKNVHPGTAKNTMVNSLRIAMEIESMLPVNENQNIQRAMKDFIY